MVAAADSVLAALADPALWVVRPGVNVFDAHQEARQDGQVETFDVDRLQRIAANCNARDAAGQPCPLTLGHTRDEAPETEQPPIVGYARAFRVEWDQRLGRYVIRADYYLRREHAAAAEQYPRTSVERWPGADFFDPIALLRRTPRLDVGQWTYGRRGRVVRYAMGESSMPDFAPPGPSGSPPASTPPPAGGAPDEYSRMCGHIQKYMAETFPHLHAIHAKYAAEAGAAGPPVPPPDPTLPPRPPAAAPPKPGETEAEKHARMAREELALKYSRLEAEVAAERHARREAEAERVVVQLQAEGYRIDRAAEVKRMAGMSEPDRAAREKEIRENYQRAPVGGDFLRTAPVQGPGGKPALTRDGMERARKYQREKQVSWEEAVAHELGTGS